MLEFKQSEQNAVRRQWMFQLVGQGINNEVPAGTTPGNSFTLAFLPDPNSLILTNNGQKLTGGGVDYTLTGQSLAMVNTVQPTDVFLASYLVPALTGQTGYGYITKNGAAATQTTNQMVEIDATNMPGFYYIALTAGELDTLGFIGLRVKTTNSVNYEDKALVSYNDPYASQGGFVAPSNVTGMGLPKAQADDLLKKIRKMIAEELAKAADEEYEEEIIEQKDYTEKLDEILAAVKEPDDDRTDEILSAIADIPKPLDFTKLINSVLGEVKGLSGLLKTDLGAFEKAVKEFESKMTAAGADVSNVSAELATLKTGFETLAKTIEEYKATLADQSDMDKRFDAMMSGRNDQKLAELISAITGMEKALLEKLINFKYDVLQQLIPKKK